MNAIPPSPPSAATSTTQAAILAAAARSFARLGYRAATMQTIASAAGFTPPTLYAHFGSKQGIFRALVEVVTGELYAVLARELPVGLSLTQHLELRVRDLLELAERQRDVFITFIVHPYDLPEVEREQDDHAFMREYWERLFVQHADELVHCTPREAALLVDGVLYSWVKAWLQTGEGSLAEQTRRLVDLILHGVRPISDE